MKHEPERIREQVREHVRYWSAAVRLERGGPFVDRSGGLIVFECDDQEKAEATVADDPFQRAQLLERWWLKLWEPEQVAGRSP